MSYCEPEWTSDYSFVKALDHWSELHGVETTIQASRRTLLVWGHMGRDGELLLEPVFEWDGPVKLPTSPGPYQLQGVDATGRCIFQLSFAPDEIDHGGAGFVFAVPVQDGWAEQLELVSLVGPRGFTVLDVGAQEAAILTSQRTGQVVEP